MMNQLPVDELEAMANAEVGEALRQTRLHYGQTLTDVESTLRIRACQIEAIEKGDMKQLPGRVYAIGFVRSYAEYLGLDSEKVVELFKSQYMDDHINSSLSFPIPASEAKTPTIWLITLSLLVTTAFFIGWQTLNKPERSSFLTVQDVPEEIKDHVNRDILVHSPVAPAVDPIAALPIESEIENMAVNDVQKTGVILNIVGSSWVEIKDGDGEVIVSNILEKGDQYFVPDSPGLSMSLGNAANVEIIIDGRPLKPLGKSGDVRRDIPLDTSYLKTLEFQDTTENKP